MTMMSARIQATIILITWGMLLALHALNKHVIKLRFLKAPIVVDLGTAPAPRPGSSLSGAGVLFVFVINIAAIGLLFGIALSPPFESASSFLRFELPLWVNVTGSVLFVLYSLWGLLVLLFNPNYTPLYRSPRRQYVIVTEGPYWLVRHPRYAAAALANLIFFMFTGFWLSLLGILGWAAVYAQAQAEERFLLTVAPRAYGEYRHRTGMFLPRIHPPAGSK
jgi:protein-S-isoprenylcysteine O-methyltransferase Ste14